MTARSRRLAAPPKAFWLGVLVASCLAVGLVEVAAWTNRKATSWGTPSGVEKRG